MPAGQVLLLEEDDARPAAREVIAGGGPGEAATHHDDVGRLGHVQALSDVRSVRVTGQRAARRATAATSACVSVT